MTEEVRVESPESADATGSRALGVLIARVVLSLLFLMAGIFKVFQMGALNHAEQFFLPYGETFLPLWSLWIAGVTVPFVELVGGGMLLVGWKSRWACGALGGVLCLVTFGHLLRDPLFEVHTHVMPRLALVVFVLLVPPRWDRFSLEGVLARWRS